MLVSGRAGLLEAYTNLDRWIVEKQFRDTKSRRHVSVNPVFHWTDGKIRCHLLACVIALTMKRLLELTVEKAMGEVTAETVLREMRSLNSVILWEPGKKKPARQIEEPNDFQSVVLKAFGYGPDDKWVLQPLAP